MMERMVAIEREVKAFIRLFEELQEAHRYKDMQLLILLNTIKQCLNNGDIEPALREVVRAIKTMDEK